MIGWEIKLLILATGIGYFCLGCLWGRRKLLFWRIKWIEMEHDLARLQGRRPRNICDVSTTTGDSANE